MKEKLLLKLVPVAVGIAGSIIIGYVVKGERQLIAMIEDRFKPAIENDPS